jgi:hypothetical protein
MFRPALAIINYSEILYVYAIHNPREMGWGGMDWIDLAQDRDQWKVLVNTIMNLRVPQNVGKLLSGCATGGLAV